MLDDGESQTRRPLKVDLEELATAFDNASPAVSYYLDGETGQVALVTDESRRELEAIYEDADARGIAFAEALAARELPDWE